MNRKPWVAFWKQDLLSSINYQSLSIFGKGLYGVLFTLCRDDQYTGQFCYPNGNPMTIDEVIDAMSPKQGDRRDRIKESIELMIIRGLLFWNDNKRLELRKYADKTLYIKEKLSGSSGEVAGKKRECSPILSTEKDTHHGTAHHGTAHNTISPEAGKPAPCHPPKIYLDMTSYEWINITPEHKIGWLKAYPAVSIDIELAKMAVWIKANPDKKKIRWERFIVNWLNRAQDTPKLGSRGSQPATPPAPAPSQNPKVTCPECKGLGEVGTPAYLRPCHICGGKGSVWRNELGLLEKRKR